MIWRVYTLFSTRIVLHSVANSRQLSKTLYVTNSKIDTCRILERPVRKKSPTRPRRLWYRPTLGKVGISETSPLQRPPWAIGRLHPVAAWDELWPPWHLLLSFRVAAAPPMQCQTTAMCSKIWFAKKAFGDYATRNEINTHAKMMYVHVFCNLLIDYSTFYYVAKECFFLSLLKRNASLLLTILVQLVQVQEHGFGRPQLRYGHACSNTQDNDIVLQ